MTPDNRARYRGPGHVESWFVRCNHPTRPLALWLKTTILAPAQGQAVAEAWLVAFDGEAGTHHAWRDTVPLSQASFETDASTGDFHLGEGGARGRVGPARVDLAFQGKMAPLCIFPTRAFIDGSFPKSKLLTPVPWLAASGTLELPGLRWEIDGWDGMQGHNWGREHAPEYAWGQCVFPGEPPAMVEGFTGRTRLGGLVSPRLSAMVVRVGEREYRFDRIFDPWRQEATITARRWTLRLRGKDGEARLRMDALDRPIACLGYRNPDGHLSHCFNSKLAEVLLELRLRDGQELRWQSPHGGALEFLRPEPEPGLPVT